MLLALAVTSQFFLAQFAPQQAGTEALEPVLEARVQRLGKELRCAVCQGLAITDSPASMARAQLDKVLELVSEGRTDDQVREYFVARYGEWVLLKPRTGGSSGLVWILPILLVIGGLGAVAYYVATHRKKPAPVAKPAAAAGALTDDDYLKAVRSELER